MLPRGRSLDGPRPTPVGGKPMRRWFEDWSEAGVATRLKIDRMLFEEESGYQHIQVFENETFGRVLALDGVIQTTTGDEFVYHEMLAHAPILAHGAIRSVLVIGGGDGGALEEVLKHGSVERATLVEIDPAVIAASKAFLREICGGAFEDPRAEIVVGDGVAYMAESARRFDLVIVDSSGSEGPGEVLFGEDFYRACRHRLSPGGLMVSQNDVPFFRSARLARDAQRLRRVFADVAFYNAAVPSYLGGFLAFGWASDEPELRRVPLELLKRRFAASGISTRYYTPEIHRSAFALPPEFREFVA